MASESHPTASIRHDLDRLDARATLAAARLRAMRTDLAAGLETPMVTTGAAAAKAGLATMLTVAGALLLLL